MDSPKRQRASAEVTTPVLTYGTDFREAYVQTRHKNLRCFPVCCAMHMEKSFCGRTIEVSAAFPRDAETPRGRPVMVGEFRCTSVAPSFNLGEATNVNDIRSSRFIFAELAMSDPWDLRFVINPNRKWFYPRTTSEGELHVYTVYLFMEDVLIGMLHSPSFKVLPIWKEERRPSMSNLLAGTKLASSISGDGSQSSEEYPSSYSSPGFGPPNTGTPPQIILQQHQPQLMEVSSMGYPRMIPLPSVPSMQWGVNGIPMQISMPMTVQPPQQSPQFFTGGVGGPQIGNVPAPGAMYINMPQSFRHQFSPVSSSLPPSPSSTHPMYPVSSSLPPSPSSTHPMYPAQSYFPAMPPLAAPPQLPQMQLPPMLRATASLPHFAPPAVRPFPQRFPSLPTNMISPMGVGKVPSSGIDFREAGQIEGPSDALRNRQLKRSGGL